MALADDNSGGIDLDGDFAAKVIEGIRSDGEKGRFNPGRPKGVKTVSAEEQRAQREAIEERQAEALAALQEQTDAAAAEPVVDVEAMFTEALAGAVEAKAAQVALAPPNPHTATKADWIRHEERVRADERAQLEAAAKPADDGVPDDDFFASLTDAATDDTVDDGEDLATDDEWASLTGDDDTSAYWSTADLGEGEYEAA